MTENYRIHEIYNNDLRYNRNLHDNLYDNNDYDYNHNTDNDNDFNNDVDNKDDFQDNNYEKLNFNYDDNNLDYNHFIDDNDDEINYDNDNNNLGYDNDDDQMTHDDFIKDIEEDRPCSSTPNKFLNNSQAIFYSLEEICEYQNINSESFFEDSFNLKLNTTLPDLNTVDNTINFISNSSIDSTIHLNENSLNSLS